MWAFPGGIPLQGVEKGRQAGNTLPDTQVQAASGVVLPDIWPQFPHLRAGGGPGQDSVVSRDHGAQAWAGLFGRRPWFPMRR